MENIEEEKITHAWRRALLWGGGSILFLVVCILLVQVSYLEREIEWSKIKWGWLLFGWICMCSALIALGKRWQVLLSDERVENKFLTASLCSGLLLNYAVPGPFGEMAAAWFVHKKYSIPVVPALVSGTAARLIGLLTAALGALFFWPLIRPDETLKTWMMMAVIGVGGGLIVLIFLMFLPKSWHAWLEKRGEEKKAFAMLHQFAHAFIQLRKPMILFWSSLWSLVGHILAFGGVWISIYAVYGVKSVYGIAFSYLMGTCIGAVAFLFPGAQLTWDASLATLLFASTDLSLVDAGLMTVILRIEQIAMMLLGAISLLWIQARLRGGLGE